MRHADIGQRGGTDMLSFGGEFALPAGLTFAALDPSVTPLRVRVQAGTGLVPIDVTIPTGTYAGNGTAGWTLLNHGRRWRFRDRTSLPANGIAIVTLDDRSQQTPGMVRIMKHAVEEQAVESPASVVKRPAGSPAGGAGG